MLRSLENKCGFTILTNKHSSAMSIWVSVEKFESLFLSDTQHEEKEHVIAVSGLKLPASVSKQCAAFFQDHGTGALVISSLLDFLTFALCAPYSETTEGQQFDMLLEMVASNGRTLFKLFQVSSHVPF